MTDPWTDPLPSLAAVAGTGFTLWRVLKMFTRTKTLIGAILLACVAVEFGGGPEKGAAKKARAAALLFETADAALPDSLNPALKWAAPFLIDLIVGLANRSGFFVQVAAYLREWFGDLPELSSGAPSPAS